MCNRSKIKASDVKRLLLRIYKRYQGGEITDGKAYREAFVLNSILKAIEISDLEQRLQDIENIMRRAE